MKKALKLNNTILRHDELHQLIQLNDYVSFRFLKNIDNDLALYLVEFRNNNFIVVKVK